MNSVSREICHPARRLASLRGTSGTSLPVTPVPPNSRFWDVYARGSYQNVPRFGAQQYFFMPGRYVFTLTSSFDTRSLSNGVYFLTVRTSDERDNASSVRERFSVLNLRSTCPGSLSAPAAAAQDEPPPVAGIDTETPAP